MHLNVFNFFHMAYLTLTVLYVYNILSMSKNIYSWYELTPIKCIGNLEILSFERTLANFVVVLKDPLRALHGPLGVRGLQFGNRGFIKLKYCTYTSIVFTICLDFIEKLCTLLKRRKFCYYVHRHNFELPVPCTRSKHVLLNLQTPKTLF